jgi:hypothetical protein
MRYVNAETQRIEDAIRGGERTIDEGLAYFSECITNAEKEVEKTEADVENTKECIEALEDAISIRTEESKHLSDEIGNLRDEEIKAHRDGDESSESSAQTMADYYEKQRDVIDEEIRELNKSKDEMHLLKYDQLQKLDADRKNLDGFLSDRSEFESTCEKIRESNVRLKKQFDAVDNK